MDFNWDNFRKKFNSSKNLSLLGVANIGGTVILGLFWLYMANLLEDTEYGEVSFLLSVASIAGIASFLGSHNTLMVYRAKELQIQSSIFSLVLILGIVSSGIVFLLVSDIGSSLYVIGYLIFGLATSEFLGTRLYKNYAVFVISQRVLMVTLAILFYFLMGYKGILIGYGLSFLPFFKPVLDGFRVSSFSFSLIQKNFHFIFNNYLLDLGKILNGHIDKLLIVPLFGYALLGNYQLGYQIIVMLGLIPIVVYQYVLPRESSGNTNNNLYLLSISFSIFVSLLVILLSPIILPNLFPKYTETISIVQIMSLNIVPVSISLMYTSKFLAKEQSRPVLIGSAIRIAIQVILIFVLGTLFGINGVAASLVISSTVEAVYLHFITKIQ